MAADPGKLGFDADTVLDESTAQALAEKFDFCVRYIGLSVPSGPGDLTEGEARLILESGMALMPVQHVDFAGWMPSAQIGGSHGHAAAINAQSVGFPPGVNVWCDLEGIAPHTSSSNVVAYCQAWYGVVSAAGFVPGLYVGSNSILTAAELYQNLSFSHYWRSMSDVPEVQTRGYQMVQRAPVEVNGIGLDPDVTQTDKLGGSVFWLHVDS